MPKIRPVPLNWPYTASGVALSVRTSLYQREGALEITGRVAGDRLLIASVFHASCWGT